MTDFTFSDPNFEARVRENFTKQSMLATLGGSMGLVQPGEVHLHMPFGAHLSQQDGFLKTGAKFRQAVSDRVATGGRSKKIAR